MSRNINFQILQGLSFIHKHGRCLVFLMCPAITNKWSNTARFIKYLTRLKCTVTLEKLSGDNLAVCEPNASSRSSHALLYGLVWILHVENRKGTPLKLSQTCTFALHADWQQPLRLELHVHTPTTNAVFIISLCSILFPLFFSLSFPSLFSLFALRLERTRCSQKMKLGTWCFKCCLGWFLCTSMVRSFHHTFSSLSSVVVLIWDLLHEPQLKPKHHPITYVSSGASYLAEMF